MKHLLIQLTFLRIKLVTLLCKYYLGKDFTPFDYIPDEVACAEAVTTILKQAGMMDRIITGTYTLYEYFNNSRHWAPTTTPKEGDIILSPTATGNGTMRGHVGIVGHNGLVYSNDSFTGLWATHYTTTTWKYRYTGQGGFPVYYYTYVSAL